MATSNAEAVVAAANARHQRRVQVTVNEERVREALRMLDARTADSRAGLGSLSLGSVGVGGSGSLLSKAGEVEVGGIGGNGAAEVLTAAGRKRRMSDMRGSLA